MNRMEGLQAGVAEMRSVAQKLMDWADDLEASFQRKEAQQNETAAEQPEAGRKGKKAAPDKAADEPAAAEKKDPALTLPEVRAVLAEKCAAGYGTQVKALIESYGVSSLREVPAEHYAELLEQVGQLGSAGGDADAG